MIGRLRREEQGVALITAIMVSMAVLTLSTVSLQLALHSSETSSYDRRRVQSIAAAEAGLDYFQSLLSNTGGQTVPCSVTKSLTGSPGTFTVTATFYATEGSTTPMSCPLATDAVPQAARVVSVGRSTAATPARTMETYLRLSVSQGGTFGISGSVFAENAINVVSTAQIGGQYFNDADLYTNGSISLASSSVIYGKVSAQGAVTLKSNANIKRDVWAGGNVSLASGADILGSATTPGSITMAGNSTIAGDAKAGGSITGGTVGGVRSPNTPGVTGPPTRAYPTFTFKSSDWLAGGYAIQTFSGPSACSAAVSYVQSTWTTGNLVVRITEPGTVCTTTFTTGTYNVKGNLAIVSDGPVLLRTNARFNPFPPTQTFTVFVFAGLSGGAPCNLTAETNSGFNPGLTTMLYVPSTCTIDMVSNSTLSSGQIIGGTINFKHAAAFAYQPAPIPGSGTGGFKQDILYRREIVTAS